MNIEVAKNILKDQCLTCIIYKDDYIYKSKERGIKPLLELVDNDKDRFVGGGAVDKVVGKAAALMYIIINIKEIHVGVISERALNVFYSNNIKVTYDSLVPYIINRKKDGMCPMEEAVWDVDDKYEALSTIKAKLRTLRQGIMEEENE